MIGIFLLGLLVFFWYLGIIFGILILIGELYLNKDLIGSVLFLEESSPLWEKIITFPSRFTANLAADLVAYLEPYRFWPYPALFVALFVCFPLISWTLISVKIIKKFQNSK